MVQKIKLPEIIYQDLISITKELTSIARKPISNAMTMSSIIAVYHAHLKDPCTSDASDKKYQLWIHVSRVI